ncbi:acyl-CoA thioesterase [Pseudomonas putida]
MSSQQFAQPHKIRFAECDPAGIVFYPQYFVMFNNLLEAWVDHLLPDIGFAGYIGDLKFGMPSVRIEADFKSVSKMGDDVTLTLDVVRLGSKSITLQLQCVAPDGDVRMTVTQVLVMTSLLTHQSIEIPDVLRQALASSSNQQ